MARKMLVNRLEKEELEYLLTIRGVGLGSCEEMRKRLSSVIRLEKEGDSIKYPPYPYTFQDDCIGIQKALDSITALLADFNAGQKSNEAQKVQTKIAYVLERIDHMESERPEDQKNKSDLLAYTLSLMDNLNEKIEDFESKQATPKIPAALNILESQVGTAAFQADIHNVSRSSAIGEATPTSGNKTIPPHKWDLQKFSGDPKSMSVHSFFERVDELRIARNVSKEILLDAGIDLFVDKAYQFYKDCRKRVNSWDALVAEFKEEYLSANHNDLLFEELRRRTQHSTETIGVYLAVMSSYFSRLGCTVSEEAKLSIVMKNLHPFYQDRLRDPLPTTMAELRLACRRMEARRDLVNSYVEPSTSRRGNILERDLAYVEVNEALDTVESFPSRSTRTSCREIVCFKCKKPGHKAIGCAAAGKRCFKCNREGYTIRNCPNCSHQGNEPRRT